MEKFGQILRNIFQRYSVGQGILITVILVGIISSVISLVLWANRPEFGVLFSDLPSSGANSILEELRNLGVPYKIENSGSTILVPVKQVTELRLKFSSEGRTGETVVGYELFDDSKMGMTTFVQEMNMRRVLEGELIKTINQFPEVRHSRVHLVLPDNNLFEDQNNGRASVVLYFQPGKKLKGSQITGIIALVANSVKGLQAENIVVLDSEGNLLSNGSGQDDVFQEAGNQWALRNNEELKIQKKVTDIIESIVGPRNTIVKVSVELNFEKIERTTESPDPNTIVVISEESHIESSSDVDSVNNTRNSRKNENTITNYEVGQTSEYYVRNIGNTKKISVAVLVNGNYSITVDEQGQEVQKYLPRSQKELDQIGTLVKSAIGFDESRGDVVEVQNIQLDKSMFSDDQQYFAEAEKQYLWANVMNKGMIVLGVLFAFLVVKMLLKNSKSVFMFPTESAALSGYNAGQGAFLASSGKGTALPGEDQADRFNSESRASSDSKNKMTENVISYVKGNPDDAAKLLRSWLSQES